MTTNVSYVGNTWFTEQASLPSPIERSSVALLADYAGYVPVLGTAVGVARIVSNAALYVLFQIASCFSQNIECSTRAMRKRSLTEMSRGEIELLPFASLVADGVANSKEEKGVLSNVPHGRYIYPIDQRNRDSTCLYSHERLEGSFILQGVVDYRELELFAALIPIIKSAVHGDADGHLVDRIQKTVFVDCPDLQPGESLQIRGNGGELEDWHVPKTFLKQANGFYSTTIKGPAQHFKIVLVTQDGQIHWLKGVNRQMIPTEGGRLNLSRNSFEGIA